MKEDLACPVTTSLSVIGGKWKVIILWQLQGKVRRFGELQKSIQGISQKMLTQELRDLEEHGLVQRRVYPVVPPKVEYRLTEFGKTLRPLMEQLSVWGSAYRKHIAELKSSAEPFEATTGEKELETVSA